MSEAYETKGLPWNGTDAPLGWSIATPESFLESLTPGFACGRSNQTDQGLVHLRPMNISPAGAIDLNDCRFVPPTAGDRRTSEGDLLFNNTNSPVWVGKTALVTGEHAGLGYSNHMTVLRFSKELDHRFMARQFHWLQQSGYFSVNCNKHVNQASIASQFLRNKLPLLVAPLAEQKRIADKLEVLLGRVDACRARLDRVPALLKRFRQSVLAAATSGKLTEEWRQTTSGKQGSRPVPPILSDGQIESPFPSMPADWDLRRSADVVEEGAHIIYGIIQPGVKLAEGVPYVRGTDIQDGKILTNQLLKTSPTIAEKYSRSELQGGDVLLGIIRATKVALVPDELKGANITQGTARFRPSSIIRSKFLAFVLEAPSVQKWLHAHYRGIDMPGLNLADVRRVPIPIPSLNEQDEIIRRVEELFTFADRIEFRLVALRKTVERLTPAVLAKAFGGELVPQDPADEPAKVLLERISQDARSHPKSSRRGRAKAI